MRDLPNLPKTIVKIINNNIKDLVIIVGKSKIKYANISHNKFRKYSTNTNLTEYNIFMKFFSINNKTVGSIFYQNKIVNQLI